MTTERFVQGGRAMYGVFGSDEHADRPLAIGESEEEAREAYVASMQAGKLTAVSKRSVAEAAEIKFSNGDLFVRRCWVAYAFDNMDDHSSPSSDWLRGDPAPAPAEDPRDRKVELEAARVEGALAMIHECEMIALKRARHGAASREQNAAREEAAVIASEISSLAKQDIRRNASLRQEVFVKIASLRGLRVLPHPQLELMLVMISSEMQETCAVELDERAKHLEKSIHREDHARAASLRGSAASIRARNPIAKVTNEAIKKFAQSRGLWLASSSDLDKNRLDGAAAEREEIAKLFDEKARELEAPKEHTDLEWLREWNSFVRSQINDTKDWAKKIRDRGSKDPAEDDAAVHNNELTKKENSR